MSPTGRRSGAKFHAANALRPLIVVLFAGVVLVIVVYLALHIRPSDRLIPEQKTGTPETSNVKENVSIVQFNLSVGRWEARADRNVEVDGKTGRLEGHVAIVDHGKRGGREIRFFGDSVTYAKDWSRFLIEGHVRVRNGEITVEASDFVYEKADDVVRTSNGIAIAAPRFSASARAGSYSLRDENLVLEGDLRLNVLSRESTVPLVLSGTRARLEYIPLRRRAIVEGGVDFSHGRSHGTAGRMGFDQFEKVDDIALSLVRRRGQDFRGRRGRPRGKARVRKARPGGPSRRHDDQPRLPVRHELTPGDRGRRAPVPGLPGRSRHPDRRGPGALRLQILL